MSLMRPTCFVIVPAMFMSAAAMAQADAETPPPMPEEATPVEPALAIEPEVSFEVVEYGSEPRRTLRYDMQPQTKQRTELRIDVSSETEMNGTAMPAEEMPPILMTLDVDVADVENGDFLIVTIIEEMTVEKNGAPMMVQMMQQAFAAMTGTTSRSRIDSRGVLRSTIMEAPDEADPQAMQMARGMEEPMTQLGVHFPGEALGEGARWRMTMPRIADGIQMVQTIEYELTSMEGDIVELNITMTQTAERQAMAEGELPPGVEVELLSMSGEGQGTARVDLRRPAALEASLESTSEVEIESREDEEVQQMKRTIRNRMELQSRDREDNE